MHICIKYDPLGGKCESSKLTADYLSIITLKAPEISHLTKKLSSKKEMHLKMPQLNKLHFFFASHKMTDTSLRVKRQAQGKLVFVINTVLRNYLEILLAKIKKVSQTCKKVQKKMLHFTQISVTYWANCYVSEKYTLYNVSRNTLTRPLR